ncbi:uncharacterized protein [Arachis hypogaea]|uniref:uncharacterized protein isoform X3 n=1 Tax=Arachis hypogaea TaxID=3818 RepID=UPI003B22590A|nr:Ulp1 protease family, carboxy-terminal domain protein [Arachis hypogaea]
MSSLRKDTHTLHNPARSNGAEQLNRSSPRRLARHPGRRSTAGNDFSKPPVTVGVRSVTPSASTPSCARRASPHTPNSLPRGTHDRSRQSVVRTESSYAGIPNALHLESLTVGSNWLSSSTAGRPRFSSYEYEQPVVPQQHRRSMDCGVWVLQWMIRGALWAIHSVTAVNDQTRMRIAIDLVLRSHNPIAIDVVEKAMSYWKKKVAASRYRRDG